MPALRDFELDLASSPCLPSVPPSAAESTSLRAGSAPNHNGVVPCSQSSRRKALFRNITRWGPTGDDFIRNRGAKYDLVAMSELHVLADELMDALNVWDSAGFNAAATPSRPLGTFRKTGGVIAGVRKNFQSSTYRHLAAYPEQTLGSAKLQKLPPGPIDFWDFVPTSWRMRGHNIVAIAAYLTSCGGAVGPNQTKLALLAGFVLALHARDIWVIAGDMNMTPQQLAQSGWLDEIQGIIVVPHNTDHTCTAGTDPRMLDYAIIAKGTEVFFPDLCAIDDGIWDSHYGLELSINADPLVSVRWSLHLPAPFPHPPTAKRAPDPNSKASRRKEEALGKRSLQATAAAAARHLRLLEARELKSRAIEAARAGKPPPCDLAFPAAACGIFLEAFEPEAEFQMDAEAADMSHPTDEGPDDYDEHALEASVPAVLCAFTAVTVSNDLQPEEEPAYIDSSSPDPAVFPKASSDLLRKECHDTLWNHATLPRKVNFEPPSFIIESTAFKQTRLDAICLGSEFSIWSSRMEAFFCELYGIDPLARRKFQGRAKVSELKLGAPHAAPAEAVTDGESNTWWAALSCKLDLLARMKGGAAGPAKISALVARIVQCAACVPLASAPKLSAPHREQWHCALLKVQDLALPALVELASAAKANKTLAAREVMRVSLAACSEWFDKAAKAGYGAVHRAAKPKTFVPSECITCRNGLLGVTKDQAEYMSEKRKPWATKWNHDGEHDPELLRLLATFRSEATEVPRDPLTVANLDSALPAEAEKKARGLVQITPSDLDRLPPAGKQQLVDLLNHSEQRAAWPWQFLAVAVAFIPKKEGDRGLGILPWLTRLWSRMRGNGLNEWIEQTADPWDDAVPGSSALIQALRRAFHDEAATANRVCAASNLWDVKEFFDSLDMLKILQAAKEYNFPPVELVLLFLEHLAPRLLRIRGAYAAPIQPHRSAVAGCRGAQQFARILLKRILFHVHSSFHPLVVSKSWVDDVNQRAEASKSAVVKACVRAGEAFATGVQELGLVIADKSRVISTAVGVAEDIAAQLTAKGFPIQAADTCPDLGIDRGRRVNVSKPTAFKRLNAAAAKCQKLTGVIRATKKWRAAKLLFCSGVQPQAAYHAQVHGLPPTRKRDLRRAAGAMLSHANRGRCLTTRLALEMGDKDPGVSIPMSLFVAWFAYMVAFPEDRTRVAAAWPRIAKLLARPNTRWRHIHGPAAAVIATLLDAGWKAPYADVWTQADGTTWLFSADFLAADYPDFSDVLSALASDIKNQLWKTAAASRNGKGLETGADLRGMVNHLSRLSKSGQYETQGAIICCATASAWPNARIHEEYPDADSLCPRCGRFPETELHRHWECSANDELKACNKSKFLIPKARAQAVKCPAFWLRGVVPAEWTVVPPPCDASDPCEENFDDLPDREGTPQNRLWLCGDGSGGVHTQDPRLRRCGWSWVELQAEGNVPSTRIHRAKSASLHGRRQTVNRAELLALLDGLLSTRGAVTFISDSAYVVNGFLKMRLQPAKYRPRSNRDLWSALKTASSFRDVEVCKIESHLDELHPSVVDGTYPLAWVKGNDAADVLAGEAAADAQVPSATAEAIAWVDAIAHLVRVRLAATLADAAEKDPHRSVPPKPAKKRVAAATAQRAALERALAATKHTPVVDQTGAYACCGCGTSAHKADALPWLLTACTPPTPLPFCAKAAAAPAGVEVRLGNATIHKSHSPLFFSEQRTWACSTCGCAAVDFMRQLAITCKGELTDKGRLNLSRLERGLMIGDSAAAKKFNQTRGATHRRPLPRPAHAPPPPVAKQQRGVKRQPVPAPACRALAVPAALLAKIRRKESLAASSSCAAAELPACDSLDTSSCAAASVPSNSPAVLASCAAADTACSNPASVPAPPAADPGPSAPILPASSARIEEKRLDALRRRGIREEQEALSAATDGHVRRAVAAYEAALPREAVAAVSPLPDVDTEDEWERELSDLRNEAAEPSAPSRAEAASPASPAPASSEEEEPPGTPIPDAWISPYNNFATLNAAAFFPAPELLPAAEEVPVDPCPDISTERLVDLVEMHNDGLPISWPAGLNVCIANHALQLRERR